MALEYHYCNKCKREFYTSQAWSEHECADGRKLDDKAKKTQEAIARMGGVEALKSLPSDMQAEIVKGMGLEGAAVAKQLGLSQQEAQNAPAPTGGDTEAPPVESISARLAALDEVGRMKQELVAAGHEVQTLSAEETKAEYEKMKAEQAAKAEAAQPTAKQSKKKATKKAE